METRAERILDRIYVSIVEMEISLGTKPTKIILGIETYRLIQQYVTEVLGVQNNCKQYATLFNIPLSIDMEDVDRISVSIEHNIKIREEDI
jgi:hypothetical protein